MTRVTAIDPGVNGGLVRITDNPSDSVGYDLSKLTPPDVVRYLWKLAEHSDILGIEQVHAGVFRKKKDGSTQQMGAVSAFTFGESFGRLQGYLLAASFVFGKPIFYVKPKEWQGVLGLKGPRDESRTDKKNRHKEHAQRIFPSLDITHALADALLLAEYLRRTVARHGT